MDHSSSPTGCQFHKQFAFFIAFEGGMGAAVGPPALGGQQGRAWSATVADKTGQMSVAVVEDQTAFVVFGACTAAEPERR